MTPFPTVLILWNTKVYVSTMNGGNISFYVEMLVNNWFSNGTILWVPYIDLDHS